MSAYIPRKLRELIVSRADGYCEYCRAFSRLTPQKFHIEHIQPQSKGGLTTEDNLCLACSACNLAKQSFTDGNDPLTGIACPLYNPRIDVWIANFEWIENGLRLHGLTAIGRATVERLGMNRDDYVDARRICVALGIHPPDL